MIEIKELYLRNFLSYGDYDTVINLEGLGPLLILGEIDGDEERKNSNGSGKSTIPDAIIWALFGRLPYKDRPADHVINWETGKNCIVRVKTKDGYTITRTRKMENSNDLLIHQPNGDDISSATNTNAQKKLEKLFDLDYEIFVSSMFFTQFDKPLLEKSDIKRKKALERMLGLQKYEAYAQVAKERASIAEEEQSKLRAAYEELEQQTIRIGQRIEETKQEQREYQQQKQHRISEKTQQKKDTDKIYDEKAKQAREQLETAEKERDAIKTYDIKDLEKKWKRHQSQLDKITQSIAEKDKLTQELHAEQTKLEIYEKEDPQTTIEEDIKRIKTRLEEAEKQSENSKTYNIPELRKTERTRQERIKEKQELQEELNYVETKKYHKQEEQKRLQNTLDQWSEQWSEKSICPECEQEVTKEHIDTKIKQLKDKIKTITEEIKELENTAHQIKEAIKNYVIEDPEITIEQANRINEMTEQRKEQIKIIQEDLATAINRRKDLDKLKIEKHRIISNATSRIEQLESEIQIRETGIEKLKKRAEEKEPKPTLIEAQNIQNQFNEKDREVQNIRSKIEEYYERKKEEKERLTKEIEDIKKEKDPYDNIINKLGLDLKETRKKLTESKAIVDGYDMLVKHLGFIRRSFSDRNKIKAYTVKRLIPHLNERITYYLQAMGCDFRLEFNEYLQAKTETYPYEFWSGGERRRIDLALMLAIHKLHNLIYSRQCNILVFDEVERSLEPSGIEAFVELIFNEFNDKTVLVISHSDQMRDAFPTKMLVRRKSRYASIIEEVR